MCGVAKAQHTLQNRLERHCCLVLQEWHALHGVLVRDFVGSEAVGGSLGIDHACWCHCCVHEAHKNVVIAVRYLFSLSHSDEALLPWLDARSEMVLSSCNLNLRSTPSNQKFIECVLV